MKFQNAFGEVSEERSLTLSNSETQLPVENKHSQEKKRENSFLRSQAAFDAVRPPTWEGSSLNRHF